MMKSFLTAALASVATAAVDNYRLIGKWDECELRWTLDNSANDGTLNVKMTMDGLADLGQESNTSNRQNVWFCGIEDDGRLAPCMMIERRGWDYVKVMKFTMDEFDPT